MNCTDACSLGTYMCVVGDVHALRNNGRVLNTAELMITVLT